MHQKIKDLWIKLRRTYVESFLSMKRGFKVVILDNAVRGATSPGWFSIYMKETLKATNEQIGLIGALSDFFHLIFYLPGGVVGARAKDKKCLYLLYILLVILTYVVAYLARDWKWLILMNFIGSFGALLSPGLEALFRDITSEATRATDFAIRDTISSFVGMINSPVMGVLADQIGLRQLFLIGAIGASLSFFLFLKLFPKLEKAGVEETEEVGKGNSEIEKPSRFKVFKILFLGKTWRAYVGLLSMGTTWRMFVVGLYPFTEIYLYETIGWTFTFFGFYGLIHSLVILLLRIPTGKLVDKYGTRPFMFLCMSAASIQWFLWAHVTNLYLIAAIYLTTGIVGIGHGVAVAKLWYAAIPQRIFPMGMAIRNVFYGISATIGALLGAYMWSNLGPIPSFYVMSGTFLLHASIVLLVIKEPEKA